MSSTDKNRLKLIRNTESLIELAYEFYKNGFLNIIFGPDYNLNNEYRLKFSLFGISPNFNFSLWKKLTDCAEYFNYIKISKKRDLKQKWLSKILDRVPEALSVFEEIHPAFRKFRDILNTIEGVFDNIPLYIDNIGMSYQYDTDELDEWIVNALPF
jgi:hypothetical protein